MLQGVVTAVTTPVSTTLAIVLLAAILVAVLLHAFSGKSCLRIPAYFLIVRNTNAYAIIAGTIAAVNMIVKSHAWCARLKATSIVGNKKVLSTPFRHRKLLSLNPTDMSLFFLM